MIAVTKYPIAIVNGTNETISRWSSVHHPVKFNIQRRDVEIVASINITGGLLVYTSTTTGLTVGSSVYIVSGTNIGVGVITSIVVNNSFECTFDNASTIVQMGGFFNITSRTNYYCITRVLGVNELNEYYIIGESYNKPDSTGLMTVDVSSWLKSLVGYTDEFQYDKMNWRDDNLGGRFNIVFAEFWTGNDGEFASPSASNLFYYTNSAKQIRDLYGSNMGAFVPFSDYDGETVLAKFLCDFETPTYFAGFPFSIDFIYSEDIADYEVFKHEKSLDINGTEITTTTNELDATECLGVNRMMIDESYTSNVKTLNVWLETDLTLTTFEWVLSDYVVTDFVADETPTPDVVIPSVITAGK
jgi:hypothetical protein